MGLGSTAKKIQKVAEIADELYTKVNELKAQLEALRDTVEETNDRVDGMDRELAEQRALIEALAEQQDIDTDAVVEDVTTETGESGTQTDA
ncbi:DUF5798 family protein [Haloarcula salina]|uniref:DUF5798 family protein n=1 Tax=Haloarcula salina TaxID=1429914 RepID=UPI003C6EBD1F